jgi:hypothetical protein
MTNVTHKFRSIYLFLFITLYMFRAPRAHHQERQIISIQPLVNVTLCWWLRRVHTTPHCKSTMYSLPRRKFRPEDGPVQWPKHVVYLINWFGRVGLLITCVGGRVFYTRHGHQHRQSTNQTYQTSLLPTCTRNGHQHRVTVTRICIDTICLS